MANTGNMSVAPELADIKGTGFDPLTDSLVKIRDEQTLMEGVGFSAANTLRYISYSQVAAIKSQTDQIGFVAGLVESVPMNNGVLSDISAADVKTQVDNGLNTQIPASPTPDSINEIIDRMIKRRSFEVTNYVLSDDLIHSNDDVVNIANGVYSPQKITECPITATIRIEFKIRTLGTIGQIASGKIYKNSVALGTERNTSTTGWETFTEDLAFAVGDEIELWVKSWSGADYMEAKELRIYGKIYQNFNNTMV